MRELCAGLIGFALSLALLWGIAGFISLEFNPLLWSGFGRFTFVVAAVFTVPFATIGLACTAREMREEQEKGARKK